MHKSHLHDAAETTFVPRGSIKTALSALSLSVALTALPQSAVAGPIQQSATDTIVSFDAADFDGASGQTTHEWLAVKPSGYSGAASVEASPNVGGVYDPDVTNSPRIDFQVEFKQAGRHYLWIRGMGATGADDSVHVGLDNKAVATATVAGFGATLGWSNKQLDWSGAYIDVPSAGVHTINVWMREDGFVLDKLVLTADASYQPADVGPELSPRAPDQTPTSNAAVQAADGLLSLDAGAFDAQNPTSHQWSATSVAGTTGSGALQASPNSGATLSSGDSASPRLDFNIEFQRTGRHYVWIRGLGATGRDDSVHVGLDNKAVTTAADIVGFNSSLGWSNKLMGGAVAVVDVPSTGMHTLNVWMREDGFVLDKIVLTPDQNLVPEGDGPAFSTRLQSEQPAPVETVTPAILETDTGLVSIDAEDFDATQAVGDHAWTARAVDGMTGSAALEATPNAGVSVASGYVTKSPRLDYRVEFVRPGRHYVWVRGLGATGRDDSVHLGLNGQEVATADQIIGFNGSFGWSNTRLNGSVAVIDVPSAGVHTVNVWMREDGFVLDKLLLAADSAFVPTADGPAANERTGSSTGGTDSGGSTDTGSTDTGSGGASDGGSSTTPPADSAPVASPDSATTSEGASVTVAVLANDSGLDNSPLAVAVAQQPSNGKAQVQSDNRITYTPNASFSGTDSFMYSVTDADGDRSVATVNVDVACTSCADKVQIKLDWAPSVTQVDGYRIYTGPTTAQATNQVADLSVSSGEVDPATPSATFNAAGDLGLRLGDQVCFKVSAYNAQGESAPTSTSCVGI